MYYIFIWFKSKYAHFISIQYASVTSYYVKWRHLSSFDFDDELLLTHIVEWRLLDNLSDSTVRFLIFYIRNTILKLNYFKKLINNTFFLCPDMSRLFIYFPLFPDLFPDLVWVVTGCHWLSRDFPGKGWCYKGPDITV